MTSPTRWIQLWLVITLTGVTIINTIRGEWALAVTTQAVAVLIATNRSFRPPN